MRGKAVAKDALRRFAVELVSSLGGGRVLDLDRLAAPGCVCPLHPENPNPKPQNLKAQTPNPKPKFQPQTPNPIPNPRP